MSKHEDSTRTAAGNQGVIPPGTVLGDRYRVDRLIGAGGMGMVYRAQDLRLDLTVALKVLRPDRDDPDLLRRFEKELVLARQVSHRHVVRIHDIGEHRDGEVTIHFITMDYVSGRSLKQLLEEEGAMSAGETARLGAQLASALAAAHEQGVIHRDLKPANVLIDDQGNAYISDFGIARSLGGAGLTRTGHVVGTPGYLAPEQARGEAVDERADIYALGLLLFEMASGRLPFSGTTYEEILAQRTSGRPRTLKEVGIAAPDWLQAIIARCLQREPAQRYRHADEAADDLQAHRSARRRIPLRWIAVPVAALAIIGAAVGVWRWAPWSGTGGGSGPVHVVAVLPFNDETGRSELGWLARGGAEMISSNLAESPTLQVVDSFRVLRTLDDLHLEGDLPETQQRQVAELLDADRLVTGHVRAAGNRLRMDARLVAVEASGLSSRRFTAEAPTAGAFELLESVSRDLRDGMSVPAVPAERVRLSQVPGALSAYAEGVDELAQGNSVSAAPALEKAVAEDPQFAAAWVRLAQAYGELGYEEKARDAAEHASRIAGDSMTRVALEARALAASLSGNPARARETLLTLARQFPYSAEPRVALAKTYGDEGLFTEAAAALKEVVEHNPNHPRAWYLLGKYAILSGDSRAAIDEYLPRALVIQNRLDNSQGRADVLNALGIAYSQMGRLDEAASHYRQAADIREEIGDQGGVAATLTNLARIHAMRGDTAAARDSLTRALEIKQDMGDQHSVANLHNEFGLLAEEEGDYAGALKEYRTALQIRQQLGDRRALSESHNNVGYAYFLLGEYDNAAVYYQQALDGYKDTGNREGEMLAQQNIGQLEIARGNWPQALESFVDALEIARAIDIRPAEAVSIGNMGRIAQLQGRFGSALSSYDDALNILEELQDGRGLAEFRLLQADALAEIGQPDNAAESLDAAGTWLKDGGNQAQIAELKRLRGELARGGDLTQARQLFQAALEEAESSGSVIAVLGARLGLARTQDDPGPALQTVVNDAESLGHAALFLQGLEALAQAQLSAGDNQDAATALARALRFLRDRTPYGRTYQLQALRHEVYQRLGDTAQAQASREAARAEIERLRADLSGDALAAFNALPAVAAIMQDADGGQGTAP